MLERDDDAACILDGGTGTRLEDELPNSSKQTHSDAKHVCESGNDAREDLRGSQPTCCYLRRPLSGWTAKDQRHV